MVVKYNGDGFSDEKVLYTDSITVEDSDGSRYLICMGEFGGIEVKLLDGKTCIETDGSRVLTLKNVLKLKTVPNQYVW